MKPRHVFSLCLVLLALLPERICAQGGLLSPYSAFGVGSVLPYLNVRNMGMGGIGTGLSGQGAMNPLNPATYRMGVDTLSVRFDIGFNLSMNGLRERRPDGSVARNQSTGGGLSNLEFYFPVCKWYKMAILFRRCRAAYRDDAAVARGQRRDNQGGLGAFLGLGACFRRSQFHVRVRDGDRDGHIGFRG